jgi:aryl-alcohol dehydrogenase-like predicted oxidoreductase
MSSNRSENTRRDLFRVMLGASALAGVALAQRPSANGLPTRRLGRTGERVSILGIGGGHIGRVALQDKPASIRLMHAAIDHGVTFFDNAWAYQDGAAEEAMGEALQGGKRDKVFLMTKCTGRDTKFAKQCLEDSLRRLKTDRIDLCQFHEVNHDNDPDWIFKKGGLEVALQAKKEGEVRHIGFTGTRTRAFTAACSTWAMTGRRRRCRSTSWTSTAAVFSTRWCRYVWHAISA